jgi:hypothetical protein
MNQRIPNPRSGFNPKSGARPDMRPRPPVLSDAADTSRDAQKLVRRPPSPFDNPYSAVNVPAPPNAGFSRAQRPYGSTAGIRPRAGLATQPHSVPRAGTTPDMLAAVGEPRLPKGYNPVNSGFPLGVSKHKR